MNTSGNMERKMDKKILIAFDDSENAMRAVEFVADYMNTDSKVTLFSVLQNTETLCGMNSPELTPYFLAERNSFCALEDKKKELIRNALDRAKTVLTDAGFKEANITVKTIQMSHGIAGDIIRESDGGYNVVALGRRGLSGIQEFFLGSVSQKVLHGIKDASVVMVS